MNVVARAGGWAVVLAALGALASGCGSTCPACPVGTVAHDGVFACTCVAAPASDAQTTDDVSDDVDDAGVLDDVDDAGALDDAPDDVAPE